ncbi:MAG: helix-turn-helix transcriptional regulator [Bacillota bacterium]
MISKNIKTLRIESKLSQKELASLLDVSYKTVSHWESGYTEPSIDAIKKLKKIFDVSYEDLLD